MIEGLFKIKIFDKLRLPKKNSVFVKICTLQSDLRNYYQKHYSVDHFLPNMEGRVTISSQ